MKAGRLTLALATGVTAMALSAAPAMAKELRVDDDGAQCPNATFTSVQAAVTAAAPGDKIKVCPGNYVEQVRIDGAGKNKLKLEAEKKTKLEQSQVADPTTEAIIRYPASAALLADPEKFIVRVRTAREVKISGFRITGPGPTGCNSLRYGVKVEGNGEAEIDHNRITEVRDDPFSGCQNGVAVQVGRFAEGEVGTAKVDHNLIDRYQKNGPTVDNVGSFAQFDHNVILGAGPTPIIAQNGVQVSRGATAKVDHNDVSGNLYTGGGTNSEGILLCGLSICSVALDGGVKVTDNEVFNNDDGIALIDADNTEVSHNKSHDNVQYDGLFADSDSEGNVFKDNQLFNNAEHDCHDDSNGGGTAGTANEWKGNKGNTQNRPGLCKDAVVQ